jgi:hypothetical protein
VQLGDFVRLSASLHKFSSRTNDNDEDDDDDNNNNNNLVKIGATGTI